jgi:hypothetical protein
MVVGGAGRWQVRISGTVDFFSQSVEIGRTKATDWLVPGKAPAQMAIQLWFYANEIYTAAFSSARE